MASIMRQISGVFLVWHPVYRTANAAAWPWPDTEMGRLKVLSMQKRKKEHFGRFSSPRLRDELFSVHLVVRLRLL